MDLKYTNGNEPVFPVKNDCEHFEGLSILDYFAAKAMHAMMANPESYYDPTNKTSMRHNKKTPAETCAEEAYLMANEMLKARAKAQHTTHGITAPDVPSVAQTAETAAS